MARPVVSTAATAAVLLVVGTALAATATPAPTTHQANTTAVPATTTPGANGTVTERTLPTGASETVGDGTDRVRLDNAEPGADTTHTILVTVDRSTTGNLTRLVLRYSDGSLGGVERADVSVGIDEGGTLPDGDVDTDLGVARFRGVDGAETTNRGIVSLDDAGPLDAGDELVVTVRNVTNPPEPAVDRVFLTAGTDVLDPGLQPLIRVAPNRTLPDGARVVATLYRDVDGDGQFDTTDEPYRTNGTAVSGRARLSIVTVHWDTTTTTTATYRDPITRTTETTRRTRVRTRAAPEGPSPTTVRGDGPGFGVPGVVAALLSVLVSRLRR